MLDVAPDRPGFATVVLALLEPTWTEGVRASSSSSDGYAAAAAAAAAVLLYFGRLPDEDVRLIEGDARVEPAMLRLDDGDDGIDDGRWHCGGCGY